MRRFRLLAIRPLGMRMRRTRWLGGVRSGVDQMKTLDIVVSPVSKCMLLFRGRCTLGSCSRGNLDEVE